MPSRPPARPHSIVFHSVEAVVFALLAGWLIVSACVVDIEYFDGFDTICNARFLAGESDLHIPLRMPMMAFVMIPAELYAASTSAHPLEVRPHHFTMVIVHMCYLFAVYVALRRHAKAGSWPVLLAFVAAIPTFLFFSYAPFISHDIAPGAIFLWMLILSNSLRQRFQWRVWILLVILGAAAALIKIPYAVFWIVTLIVHLVPVFGVLKLRRYMSLVAGAIASGAITWLVFALVLHTSVHDGPWWLRPYTQLTTYAGAHSDWPSPAWVYFRSAWAFGTLAMLLTVPALFMSFRNRRRDESQSDPITPMIALAWILVVLIMHLLSVREVRYLAFVAPLTAFLIVKPISLIMKWRLGCPMLLVILAFDAYNFVPEAARIVHPFYRNSDAKSLLAPLLKTQPPAEHILLNRVALSFSAPHNSPFAADLYHRQFHFGARHLRVLFRYDDQTVVSFDDTKQPHIIRVVNDGKPLPDGTPLLFSTAILENPVQWKPGPPVGRHQFFQCVAFARTFTINRHSIRETRIDGRPVIVIDDQPTVEQIKLLVLPVVHQKGRPQTWLIKPITDRSYHLVGMNLSDINDDRLIVRGFEIQQYQGQLP